MLGGVDFRLIVFQEHRQDYWSIFHSNMLYDILPERNEMIQAIWVFGKSILPESAPRDFELAYQIEPFPQVSI